MKKKYKSLRKIVDWLAVVLLLIGGINWGLVGIANIDLVQKIFGSMLTVSKVVYISIGVSALWVLLMSVMRKFMK